VKCDAGAGVSYIMHNKFFVFDHEKVWTGSTNISDTELGGEYNSDVAVTLSSKKLAAIYGAEFAEMYAGLFHRRKSDNTEHVIDGDAFGGRAVVKSYFSPTDHARDNAVMPLIAAAAHTLDIAMFYFTSEPIAGAVLAAKKRGVAVRMIIDATGAASAATKHHLLCANGIAVKTENWGGKSHGKWAVADAGFSGAAVVFGSMNWTGAGDEQNDENTLYVENGRFASSFRDEFEREWADLARVPVCARVSAEGADSSVCDPIDDCSKSCTSGSCCDGIDNDYDGKIDLQDEACACADGIDNDGDGFVDKDDSDCRSNADPD
jgi:phosphatidylserine/phosphatidylglycerophosphate/cardiolipin synthase-like enzyme